MRELWSTKNTYTVLKDGEIVGWIRFVKWESRPGWFIEEVSPGLPVTLADFNAEGARAKLNEAGYSWEPGENRPYYIYINKY